MAERPAVSAALHVHNAGMKRTTIVAPEELLDRLRLIAQEEDTSLAQVIREALEWRVSRPDRTFHFTGAGQSSESPHDTARQAGEMTYTPRSWR